MRRYGLIVPLLVVLANRAFATEDTILPARTVQAFSFDADTTRGYWAEILGRYQEDSQSRDGGVGADGYDRKTRRTTIGPRLVYGTNLWEAGLFVPFELLDVKLDSNRAGASDRDTDKNGLGDLEAYAKVIPLRLEHFDFGGGVQVSLPTGDEKDGLGTGEFGVLPFATAVGRWKSLSAQVHAGYEVFSAESDSDHGAFSDDLIPVATNRLRYGGALNVALSSRVALRAELLGTAFPARGDSSLTFAPGFDVRIPIEGLDVVLRPTASFGVTHDSPDWGFGGSLVIANLAGRPAPPAPPAVAPAVKDIVVLLEQPDGKVGALTVTTRGGSVDLTREGAAAEVATEESVAATTVSEEQVRDLFGAALAAQPAAPYQATVLFDSGRMEPNAESLPVLAAVVEEILRRQAAEVTITGHADRVGSEEFNERLSLQRAVAVRDWLLANKVAPDVVKTVERGESAPLVPTRDDVAEQRNRRVEISIR